MRSGTKAKSRPPAKAKPPRERARAYRERMKKQGMRLVQKWELDRRSPAFRAELKREARLLARPSQEEEEIMRFIESLYEDWNN
ncbi:MAG TPA: antitoxin MazE-like protein [Stellaceae bacterium]|nr:antitoxin MazE-like protein [Stellaceae bacterium]